MATETSGHWDRAQWADDDEGPDTPTEQGRVWRRDQAIPDLPERHEPAEQTRSAEEDPEAGPLSGHGKGSGEGHFDRTEPADR